LHPCAGVCDMQPCTQACRSPYIPIILEQPGFNLFGFSYMYMLNPCLFMCNHVKAIIT